MRPKVNPTSDSDIESIFSVEEPSPAVKKTNDRKYVCSIEGCGEKFRRMVHLDRHEFKHTGVKKYPCVYPNCDKSYTIITHLKRHVREVHEKIEKPKNVKCLSCDKMFISEFNMERHIRDVHKNRKVYSCSYCSEEFKHKLKLKIHEVTHTGVTPFNCEKCKKGFVTKCFLKRHVCKVYKCNVCETHFKNWSELTAHRKAENHKDVIYKCEYCDKVYKRNFDLVKHESTHKDDKDVFVCTHEGCSRFYAFQRNLQAHIRVAHEGLNFPCTVEGCSLVLRSKKALNNHIKVIHIEKKARPKKLKNPRAVRKDAGRRKRSALSKLSGVLIDKEVDKMVMEGTAEIEIELPAGEVLTYEDTHCPYASDVEEPKIIEMELSRM